MIVSFLKCSYTRFHFLGHLMYRCSRSRYSVASSMLLHVQALLLCRRCTYWTYSDTDSYANGTIRFSLVWLSVMALFPISLLLLKFNRGRLPRTPKTPVSIVILTLAVVPSVFAGNIAIDPITFGYGSSVRFYDPFLPLNRYFSAYFVAIVVLFSITQKKAHLLRCVYWTYDQYPMLQRWNATKLWASRLMNLMTRLRRKPVCILAKIDEVSPIQFSSLTICLWSVRSVT